MAIRGVSSGRLSSTIGSDAEPDADGPGRLLECAATNGPLGISSPVKLKSTLL